MLDMKTKTGGFAAPSLEGRRGMIASVATTGTLAPSRSAAEQHSLGWVSPFIRILRGLRLTFRVYFIYDKTSSPNVAGTHPSQHTFCHLYLANRPAQLLNPCVPL